MDIKSYFAKYLSVEGGKKLFFTNANSLEGLISAEGLQDTLIEEKKLFLCSRDIKVKELKPRADVFYDDRGRTHQVTQSWIDSRTIFPKQWFKVIGEISPEAIWVKEGDEFDYEQVKISYSCEKGNECDLYFGEQLCSAPHALLNPIEIECPTCKKFH